MPYTSIVDSALEIGIPMREIRRMSWGRLVLMLQARADAYDDEPEEATFTQIKAAFGA